MRSIFFLFFAVFFASATFGQEIRLLVKKGIVTVNDKLIKPSDGIVLIQSPSTIKVNPTALVFVKKSTNIRELQSGREYKYDELKKLFGKSKSFTKSYLSVLTNQDYSIKVQYGKSIRGKDGDPLWYSPADTATILSDSIILVAGGASANLLTDIQLFGSGMKDTVFLSREKRIQKIKTPAQGEYFWKYDAEYMTVRSFRNHFIVPPAEKKQTLLKAYQEYLDAIKEFSSDMQTYLMEEYCYLNKVYVLH